MVLGSSRRRQGGARIAAWAAAAVLMAGAAVTGCGDDNGSGSSMTSPSPSVQRTDRPADPAAAKHEVTENWERFFDPKVSLDDKEALLENGSEMREVLNSFSHDERGNQVTANVSAVKFTSATEADVRYTLALNGNPALRDAAGVSVEQDGTWKVSVRTLCALVQLSSGDANPVPGC
ncbi:hypothetical protein [Streptomyces boluensis]|uniref:Low molecular weight antigen MTB12-like C-terminal domain-containing protein n=1 Tax=Streptomyces boluensis TaxID=1775135 RepID=A0A964UPJ9_9ACTN|nr:hypothetical protein [Streptomyces boluensis]NBE53073.1 hypothetical protein [Streptomyces boluensis]